jgi:hypothetical protein
MKFLKIFLFVALFPLLLLLAAIAGIFDRGRKCTPGEFAEELRKFADGRDSEWDWDDFESVRLRDPLLEKIRQEALITAIPLTDGDKAKLRMLAERADELAISSL